MIAAAAFLLCSEPSDRELFERLLDEGALLRADTEPPSFRVFEGAVSPATASGNSNVFFVLPLPCAFSVRLGLQTEQYQLSGGTLVNERQLRQ